MKLQTRFYLGIAMIFAVLAVVIAVISVNYVNTNTIREAEQRVKIVTKAAWEIYNARPAQDRAALEVLAQKPSLRDLLVDPEDRQLALAVGAELESIRREHDSDILDLLAPDGSVILRAQVPHNVGDSVATDPLVSRVLSTQQAIAGTVLFEAGRLSTEGSGLVERCLATDQDPRGMLAGAAMPVIDDGKLIGIIEMGSLLNGSVEEVDRIRDAVFENEVYKGKPVGTATIFMQDLRISTNVLNEQGQRAMGTRVSQAVAEQVLEKGMSWTGRAFVVDTWYLSQYDPIREPEGRIIGMLYVGELEQRYLDLRTRAVVLYLSVVLGGMLLAFFVASVVIRNILGPIRTLSEATGRISVGDLAVRVPVKSKDDVGMLSASFNQMAAQLAEQRQKLARSQQELETLNAELRSINRNYMEMLGFVSHELKNPLASAVMSLYTVKDGFLGEVNPAQARSLNSVAQSLDYFQDMIRNYLDLSRLEKGELAIRKAQISLESRVIVPVMDALERELQDRRMMVENRIPDNLVLVADGDLLRIVYNNLLTNALKYGREGGRIVLVAREEADTLILTVRNDSEGIPPDKMSMLFKKFSRLDTPEYAGKRGTGLGLYICREIVEKHGGTIWADSKAGECVEFSFALPRTATIERGG
jgi:two-component system NtrC family sensor kinase